MTKKIIWSLWLLLGGASLAACGDPNVTYAPEAGAVHGDGSTSRDGATDASTRDGAHDGARDQETQGEAAPTPQRVLVTTNNSSTSELIAVNIATRAVDGRFTFPGFLGATYAHDPAYPFLLEQANDIVARLDPVYPWRVDSSWNIALHDGFDGGYPYSDPMAVVVGAGNKGYVLRYDRNEIAIIQTVEDVDAGPPVATIDLSLLLQKNDTDGTVEMTSGVYVASKHLLYVVLENIDQRTVVPPTYDLICTGTVSTVIAIDTTTDALVTIGSGPHGSIPLLGFDPVFDGTLYDAANDRLLILEAGCNLPPTGDAGPGALHRRGVEEVDLTTGTTKGLLNLSKAFKPGEGYPTGFVFIPPDLAVLGFDATGSEVYAWIPSKTTLGPKIHNAPDVFTYDGAGNLVGTVTTYGDGGTASTQVVSVAIGTGDQTVISAPNPFTINGGFIGSVDMWPRP
jgi:hypothetical protein